MLYWQRHCGRCGVNERRWFRIPVPKHARQRIRKPMPVSRYLVLVGQKVPRPEDVPVGGMGTGL
jgi:hypothetical protein